MTGHCSIQQIYCPDIKEGSKVRFIWRIYAGNFREIAKSKSYYKQPHNAISAAKRFIRLIGDVEIRNHVVVLGVGRHYVIHRDKRKNKILGRIT